MYNLNMKINYIFGNLFIFSLWGLGIGDWGLGIAQSPIPNPQSPMFN